MMDVAFALGVLELEYAPQDQQDNRNATDYPRCGYAGQEAGYNQHYRTDYIKNNR